MTHTRITEGVRIEMSTAEWERLLLYLGMAAGMAANEFGIDSAMFWGWIELANDLNTGNPQFDQYEIPDQFQRKKED
jgi:predicted DNA-binding protein (UPF0251 family)